MIPVLYEFRVLNNLGVFISDNINSNDNAVKAIVRDTQPGVD